MILPEDVTTQGLFIQPQIGTLPRENPMIAVTKNLIVRRDMILKVEWSESRHGLVSITLKDSLPEYDRVRCFLLDDLTDEFMEFIGRGRSNV